MEAFFAIIAENLLKFWQKSIQLLWQIKGGKSSKFSYCRRLISQSSSYEEIEKATCPSNSLIAYDGSLPQGYVDVVLKLLAS